ncbi:MAG: hypothetical protein AAGK04_06140 [Planctomycetota bacterium]
MSQPTTIRLALLALLAACCSFGGCASPTRFAVEIEGPRIASGAPTGLDIRNSSGNVFVKVQPHLNEPEVRATLRSVDPSVSPRPVNADPGAIVMARAEEFNGRQVLRVEADTPPDVTGAVQIDLEILTPTCDGIRVQNAGGYVRLWGVAGAVDVDNRHTTPEGLTAKYVEVRSDQPISGPVQIRTADDDIYFVVGGNSSGTFEITVPDGHDYSLDIRLGSVTNAKPETNRWTGVFNNGTQPIRLDAASGEVLVRVYEKPMGHKARGISTPRWPSWP